MAGRPAAPVHITNNVLPGNMLAAYECRPRDIYDSMNDDMQWLIWLAEHRVIVNKNDCANCQRPMSLVRRTESPDGYSWKCVRCNTRTSIRTGSFFDHCLLSTQKIVMMLYYWIYEVKCKHVMLFENIDSWDTIVKYNNFFRMQCHNWLQTEQVELGGFDANGQPTYIEVDETYFLHRKYHRGRHRRGKWVVGIIERVSGRTWMEVVRRRDAATLRRIVEAHVLAGSIIVTDEWAGYANVNQWNNGTYQHEVVVHARMFVDEHHPDIHTETIEGFWMHAKRKLRYQSGTSRALFASYLSEFQWRFRHKACLFGKYLKMLSYNYQT